MADENALGSCGYHVIDEGDQYESDEDLEEIDEEEQQQILGLHGVATGNKTVKETSDKTPVIKEKPNAYNSEGMFDNKQTEEDEFVKIDMSDDEELDVSDWMLS